MKYKKQEAHCIFQQWQEQRTQPLLNLQLIPDPAPMRMRGRIANLEASDFNFVGFAMSHTVQFDDMDFDYDQTDSPRRVNFSNGVASELTMRVSAGMHTSSCDLLLQPETTLRIAEMIL